MIRREGGRAATSCYSTAASCTSGRVGFSMRPEEPIPPALGGGIDRPRIHPRHSVQVGVTASRHLVMSNWIYALLFYSVNTGEFEDTHGLLQTNIIYTFNLIIIKIFVASLSSSTFII